MMVSHETNFACKGITSAEDIVRLATKVKIVQEISSG